MFLPRRKCSSSTYRVDIGLYLLDELESITRPTYFVNAKGVVPVPGLVRKESSKRGRAAFGTGSIFLGRILEATSVLRALDLRR
jgi:hypothetical protein